MLSLLAGADGVVRGHRSGLLTAADYNNLAQCESLDDIKLNLVQPTKDTVDHSTLDSAPFCLAKEGQISLAILYNVPSTVEPKRFRAFTGS